MFRNPFFNLEIQKPRRGVPLSTLIMALAFTCNAKENQELVQKQVGPDAKAQSKSSSARPAAQAAASPKDLQTLVDQEGQPFSFAKLAKKTVLVNFIFTNCPLICPTQTQALIGFQQALPPALRTRVRILSVTVDPDRDSALALKQYAMSMGVDFTNWSFVTGKSAELNWLYRYYSVGVNPTSDGLYDHQAGVYLVDAQGRVMQRYTGAMDRPRLLREVSEIDALNP